MMNCHIVLTSGHFYINQLVGHLKRLKDKSGESCFGGIATYEKTFGVYFNVTPSQELIGPGKQVVTPDCAAFCSQSNICTAFTIDYKNGLCVAYDKNSIGRRDSLLLQSGSTYFEETCFRGVGDYNAICGDRIWAFERIVGAYLDGFDDKEERNVNSKVDCQRLCLTESFCRSAEYDELNQICRLSREDRRTKPSAFKFSTGSSIDYLENQCCKSSSCKLELVTDVTINSFDDVQYTANVNDCQKTCAQTSLFSCWSFAYDDMQSKCYLSGDETSSVDSSNVSLIANHHDGIVYGEKHCDVDVCSNGSVTYEKVSSFTLRSSMLEPLPINKVGHGITLDCLQKCEQLNVQCSSLVVDYVSNKCFRVNRGSQDLLGDVTPFTMHSYYEKICLRGINYKCRGKAWTFERVPNHELIGFDDKIVKSVQNRQECEEICLQEQSFECRSAEFVYGTSQCRLSAYDRRDKAYAFRQTTNKVDYLENVCAGSNFEYQVQKKEFISPTFVEVVETQVNVIEDCINICSTFHKFTCRTAGYRPQTGECLLSGDDIVSAGNRFTENHPETILIERKYQVTESKKIIGPSVVGLPIAPGYTLPDISHLWNYFTKSMFTPPTATMATAASSTVSPTTRHFTPRPSIHQGGRCSAFVQGYTEYEKISGSILKAALTTVQLSTIKGDREITEKCKDFCHLNRECLSFNINYRTGECVALSKDSSSSLATIASALGSAYFEPVCFQSSYNYVDHECRLSGEDRFTKPFAFATAPDTDYLENQCSRNLTLRQRISCQFTAIVRNKLLTNADKIIQVSNETECRIFCETELQFVCRAYSFVAVHVKNLLQQPDCYLSADTRHSEGAELINYPGAVYVERLCSISSITTTTIAATSTTSDLGHRTIPPTTTQQTTERTSSSSTGSTVDYTTSQTQPTMPPTTSVHTIYGNSYNTDNKHSETESIDRNCSNVFERTMSSTVDNSISANENILVASTNDHAIYNCFQQCTQRSDNCLAFALHYPITSPYTTCLAINNSAFIDRQRLIHRSAAAYFSKICLKVAKSCGKLWTFDRVIGYYMNDTYAKKLNLKSKDECEEACLLDTQLPCRSVSYVYSQQLCSLSSESRRTRPESFVYAGHDVDYIENHCSPEISSGDYVYEQHRFNPFFTRIIRGLSSIDDCQLQCGQETNFICRSISYESLAKICYLSAEDKFSVKDGQNVIQRFGSTYAEKTGYSQVKVACTSSEMVITLQFDKPFDGVIYAKTNPLQCYFPGNSQTLITINFPFGVRCGTIEQSPGHYINDIVIQQHSLILTANDKIFRIVCSSSLTDKTVKIPTEGKTAVNVAYGNAQLTSPPTLLSNVAIAPHVQMRITDANGRDVNSVNMGDLLFLRIEQSPFSNYGISAKNLVARSEYLEFIVLIDFNGCAIDPYVFPNLEQETGGKNLVGPFHAFRFASTGLLYFEVDIQFCQTICPLPKCDSNSTRNRHSQRDLMSKMQDNLEEDTKSQLKINATTPIVRNVNSLSHQITNNDHVSNGVVSMANPLPLRTPLRVT
ncbi:hypothetical protein CHUAL_013634 [Chamberlinius hualienensis]